MVKDFAELFKMLGSKIFNYDGKVIFDKSSDPDYMTDNPNRRCPSIEKARQILGFNPSIYVEEGVERYLKFLKNNNKRLWELQ